jgi:predicted phage terminase large subunit-like protein
MASLNLELLPWQQEVLPDNARFKVIAAGRRTGKSHLAAVSLVLNALNGKPGKVFYVAPTQGMARDIMWDKLYEVCGDIIEAQNINNLTLTLSGNNTIFLKGSDRPDTLRGVSLKHLVMDEYAYMKPDTFESILRPALSDQGGSCIFIGTPEGRNHFYDLYVGADSGTWEDWKSYHYTSYDNPIIPKKELEHAKNTLPSWAFQQEYMASFQARGSEYFKADDFQYYKRKPSKAGDFYVAVDLAGFRDAGVKKTKRRDSTAIAVVYVTDDGHWYVDDILHGQWDLNTTAERIFRAVEKYRPASVGIERGIAQQAVMSPLQDLMRRTNRVFRVELLSHANQKKQDRILWALQGRFENGLVHLKKGDWNLPFVDEASNFPSPLVHDDLLDALSYIDQLAQVPYLSGYDVEDEFEPEDAIAGY